LLGRAELTIARVREDEARRLANMTCQFALGYLKVKTWDEVLNVTGGVRDAIGEMHERVGTLLREFDEE
jgi:hypothetical protein